VIVASNESLEAAIGAKTFRSDLYFRIARLQIQLPPLRERVDDIPLLVEHFLKGIYGEQQVTVSKELMQALKRHAWPGNVRELKNAVELIALLAGDAKVLGPELFLPESRRESPAQSAAMLKSVPAAPPKPTPEPGPSSSLSPSAASLSRSTRYSRERLQQLRSLFQQHNKLSHAEVVRMLECAPGTAMRDLEQLEMEGAIQRVRLPASNRTSHFIVTAPQK
jgi:DNA-binding NtrC family response regulator